MIIDFIRNYFILLNCFFVYYRLLNEKILQRSKFLVTLLLPCSLAILLQFLEIVLPTFSIPLLFTIYWIIMSFIKGTPKISFATCTISFVISYSAYVISATIITGLFVPIYFQTYYYSRNAFFVIYCLFQCFIIFGLFRIKRFRNGMPYLYSTKFVNSSTLLGILILSITVFMRLHKLPNYFIKFSILFCLIFSSLALIHWWQSQLTKSYRKRLREMELESLRTELQQRTEELERFQKQNEEMGRLIHKDNKLIPAMEHAVARYLSADVMDAAAHAAEGQALLTELRNLSETRQGILADINPSASIRRYNTGLISLDAILEYMFNRATAQSITFHVSASKEIIETLPDYLPEEKLTHLLSDLIENAIIAVRHCTERVIQLQFYRANNTFALELSDSGIPFEPATLIAFGNSPASTHLDEGGSGIGLMDIWKIKKETRASIHIHEYESGNPYTKTIYILFDRRDQYCIHTWRHKELAALVNRGDINILPLL